MERISATCRFNKITRNMLEKIFIGTMILPFYIISKALQYIFIKPVFKFCYDYFIYPCKSNPDDIEVINACENISFFDKPKFHRFELFGLGLITFPVKIISNLFFGIYKLSVSIPSCYKRVERLISLKKQSDLGVTFLNFRTFDIKNYDRENKKHKKVSYSHYMYRTKDENGIGIGENDFHFFKDLGRFKKVFYMISICLGIHTIKFLSRAKKMDDYEEKYGSVNISGFVPGNHEAKQKNDILMENMKYKNNTVDVHFDGVMEISSSAKDNVIVPKENICAVGNTNMKTNEHSIKEKCIAVNGAEVDKKPMPYVSINYEKKPEIDKARICSVNSVGMVKNNFHRIDLMQSVSLQINKQPMIFLDSKELVKKNILIENEQRIEFKTVLTEPILVDNTYFGYEKIEIQKEDGLGNDFVPKQEEILCSEADEVCDFCEEDRSQQFVENIPQTENSRKCEQLYNKTQDEDFNFTEKNLSVCNSDTGNYSQKRKEINYTNIYSDVILPDFPKSEVKICTESVGFVPKQKAKNKSRFSLFTLFKRTKKECFAVEENIPNLQDDWRVMQDIPL